MAKTKKLNTVTKKLSRRKPTKRKKKARKIQVKPLWVAAGLAAVALAILIPHWIAGGDHQTGARVPAGYSRYGRAGPQRTPGKPGKSARFRR